MSSIDAPVGPSLPTSEAPAGEAAIPAAAPAASARMRRGRRGGRPLLRLLDVTLTLACLLVVGASAVALAPQFFAYQTYVVRTGSMAPTIAEGSLVVVVPVKPTELKVGDVITFRRPELPEVPVTHRIVSVRYDESRPGSGPIIRTKGDANPVADAGQLQLEGTAWRVSLSVPLLGYALDFIRLPAGRLLFMVVPGAALALVMAATLWRRLRRERR